MKIKTAELTGAALRWAAGTAKGHELSLYGVDPSIRARVPGQGVHAPWAPDTYWHQGGPIIERERIELRHDGRQAWCAWIDGTGAVHGPTALTAAMRCYVASKLGDEVEVPEELT